MNIIERSASYTASDNNIDLAINRNDIANLLGLRRDPLSSVFSKFQKNQLIQVKGKKIKLMAEDKLAKLSGF